MISIWLDENTVSFIAEETDDLLKIRRLLKNGDKIVGVTTRVIKLDIISCFFIKFNKLSL